MELIARKQLHLSNYPENINNSNKQLLRIWIQLRRARKEKRNKKLTCGKSYQSLQCLYLFITALVSLRLLCFAVCSGVSDTHHSKKPIQEDLKEQLLKYKVLKWLGRIKFSRSTVNHSFFSQNVTSVYFEKPRFYFFSKCWDLTTMQMQIANKLNCFTAIYSISFCQLSSHVYFFLPSSVSLFIGSVAD